MRQHPSPAREIMDRDFNSSKLALALPAGYTIDAYMSGDLPVKLGRPAIRRISVDDIVIAVMGPTGAGKSSFINLATRQVHTAVGHSLESCTQSVNAVSYPHPDGSGRNVVLVDTPGFNDTNMSDSDILASIARWFATTYTQRITLSGLLFFHRISDNRISGNPLRNLLMFEKLCGAGALRNVILTTTMWDEIDEELGSVREQELKANYWRSMIACGSRIARFGYTYESAWEIIGQFSNATPRQHRQNRQTWPLRLHRPETRVLSIQREMVDEKKPLHETRAGSTLLHWLDGMIATLREKLHALEMRLRSNPEDDPEDPEELEREKEETTRNLERVKQQKEALTSWILWRFLRDVAEKFRIATPPGSRASSPAARRSSRKHKHLSSQTTKQDSAWVIPPLEPLETVLISGLTETTSEPEPSRETLPQDPTQRVPQPDPARITPRADSTPKSPQAEPVEPSPKPDPAHITPKSHHHDERHGRSRTLASLVNGLKHAQSLKSLSSVPFLPAAVQILLTVAQTLQGMECTHHSLLTVTANAGWLIVAVTKQLEKGEVSEDVREMIVDLTRSLEDVQSVVTKFSSHDTATRYVFQDADEMVLAECHDSIRSACDRFQVQAVISIHHAILRLNASCPAHAPPLCHLHPPTLMRTA